MLRSVRVLSIALFLSTSTAAAAAEVQRLTPNVSVLIGKYCNVLIVPGDNGVLIVDNQFRSNVDETLAGVKEVSTAPVRFVIDTHWHLDHAGANLAFATAGASIIAQRAVRERRSTEQYMAAYKRSIPADPPAALPSIVYDDTLELRQGTETIVLRHAPKAHTDGDSIVWFKDSNIIALGDLYFNGIFPFIDRSSGGSVQGMIAAIDMALGMGNDTTRFVPAHGAVATRAEVVQYRNMLQDIADRVRAAMRAGKSSEEIVASHPAADYRKGMEGEEDRLVEAVYDSLSAS